MNDLYDRMGHQFAALIEDEQDFIANCANCSALLMSEVEGLNWAGFYFARDGELVLGPFQGMPACTRIAWGEGVCGTAAEIGESILVPDVHAFPGHIACDAESRSELVVPVKRDGAVVAVIDLDSPRPSRFDADDAAGIEALAELLAPRI